MYNMTSAAFIINVSSFPKCHLGIWLPAGFIICMLPFNLLPFRGLHILTAECFVHNIPKSKISFQWHVLDVDGFQHYDSLVQDCSNSSGLAMELLQSCTKLGVQFLWNNFAMHLKLHSFIFWFSKIQSFIISKIITENMLQHSVFELSYGWVIFHINNP